MPRRKTPILRHRNPQIPRGASPFKKFIEPKPGLNSAKFKIQSQTHHPSDFSPSRRLVTKRFRTPFDRIIPIHPHPSLFFFHFQREKEDPFFEMARENSPFPPSLNENLGRNEIHNSGSRVKALKGFSVSTEGVERESCGRRKRRP